MIQRRACVGIAVAASALLLTACGFQSPDVESGEQASVQATDFAVGGVHLGDTSITAVTTATSAPHYYLIVTIVNDAKTTDTFTGATTPAGTLTLSDGPITLLPGVPVELAVPTAGSTGPTMAIAASPLPQAGGYLPVVFSFANAGNSPTVQVPVVPAGETTAPTQAVPTATASVPTEVGATAND